MADCVFTRMELSRPSASGEGDIRSVVWQPEETACVLQIAHGMAEHADRYAPFAEFLAARGVAVYMNDHLGHGGSAHGEPGVFTHRRGHGFDYVLADMRSLTALAKKEHPGKPVMLLGHSMGSILAGLYGNQWGDELAGLILMGTPAPNRAAFVAGWLAGLIRLFGGDARVSPLLCAITGANMTAPNEAEAGKHAWLSYDLDNVKAYDADPMCGFPFTVGAVQALIGGLARLSAPRWGAGFPKELPVLVISGADDACGAYGKAPMYYQAQLEKRGVRHTKLELVRHARHEILNETNRKATWAILLTWLKTVS